MTQVTSTSDLEAPKTPGSNKTPNRITNNYADASTPITSMKPKRPRSSLNGAQTPSAKPGRLSNTEIPLSPMHPVKPVHRDAHDGVVKLDEDTKGSSSWVTRKVDALFSPVLRMLEHNDEEENLSSTSDGEGVVHGLKHIHHDDDKDVHSDDCSISIQGQEMPESDEFNPWQFIQSLPPYQEISYLRPGICLPPKDPQAPPITLVLDLDETLVHCSVEPVPDADLVFPVDFHGITYQVHVKKRPFLETFLKACCGKFEVVLFTASQKIYANELLNRIDPGESYFFKICWFFFLSLLSCSWSRREIHSTSAVSWLVSACRGKLPEGSNRPWSRSDTDYSRGQLTPRVRLSSRKWYTYWILVRRPRWSGVSQTRAFLTTALPWCFWRAPRPRQEISMPPVSKRSTTSPVWGWVGLVRVIMGSLASLLCGCHFLLEHKQISQSAKLNLQLQSLSGLSD